MASGKTATAHSGRPLGSMNAMVRRYSKFDTMKSVMLLRCGERMDRTFPEWLQLNFDDQGVYTPTDMNQPMRIPQRRNSILEYDNDAPITETGQLTAAMLGRGMKIHHVSPVRIVCSPALRCVQTASYILKALGESGKINICIEPGLFDWMKSYKKVPMFLTPQECKELEYPIDVDYRPMMKTEQLTPLCEDESVVDYYVRTKKVAGRLLSEGRSGLVLLVGHGTTVDSVARGLIGKGAGDGMKEEDMYHMGIHYPYMSMVSLVEKAPGDWRFVHDMVPPINYLSLNTRPMAHYLNR